MLTILMTTDTVGGVWSYALQLANALASSDVHVHLATLGTPSDSQRSQAARLSNLTLHESSYKLEWMNDPWEDVNRSGQWLLELESALAPDVIHLNGYAHGALAFRAPKLIVAHSCVCSWWQSVKGESAPAEWNEYRRRISSGLHSADLVIAPTQSMLAALIEQHGALYHTRVIHNGRDGSRYRRGPKQYMILSAGRVWDPAKNITALDTIAHDIPWPVFVAGDTTSPQGQTSQLANVHTLGPQPHEKLICWFTTAAIYALPARYEPFGLSVLEAALSGCALVLGDIPSLRELWSDVALFVDPNDPAALRDAITTLIHDQPQREQLAHRAYFRAQHYGLDPMTTAYMQAYRDMLAARMTWSQSETTARPTTNTNLVAPGTRPPGYNR